MTYTVSSGTLNPTQLNSINRTALVNFGTVVKFHVLMGFKLNRFPVNFSFRLRIVD